MPDEPNTYSERAERLYELTPALIADVQLFSADEGGRRTPGCPGWGCPCMLSREQPLSGYDGWMVLDKPLHPGEKRADVPFVFLSPEGGEVMRKAGHFYLWEGGFIGEAVVAT